MINQEKGYSSSHFVTKFFIIHQESPPNDCDKKMRCNDRLLNKKSAIQECSGFSKKSDKEKTQQSAENEK